MKKTETTCDNCERDLSDSGPKPDYMLILGYTHIPTTSQVVYGIMLCPPIDRTHHFCGLGCLKKWLDRKFSHENN